MNRQTDRQIYKYINKQVYRIYDTKAAARRSPNYPRWAELNGANAVSFVAVRHILEISDNFWQVK